MPGSIMSSLPNDSRCKCCKEKNKVGDEFLLCRRYHLTGLQFASPDARQSLDLGASGEDALAALAFLSGVLYQLRHHLHHVDKPSRHVQAD